MNTAAGKAFYKYMSANTAHKVLKSRCLWWSRPSLFNDPFDCHTDYLENAHDDATINHCVEMLCSMKQSGDLRRSKLEISDLLRDWKGVSTAEFRRNVRDFVRTTIRNSDPQLSAMREKFNSVARSLRILCVSTRNDDPLMWSHYAQSHRGVVIELTPDASSPISCAKPVVYQSDIPQLLEPKEWAKYILEKEPGINLVETAFRVYRTKCCSWRHEREWRCIYPNRDVSDDGIQKVEFHNEVTGVYLGCRCGSEETDNIIKLVKQSHQSARVYRAKTVYRQYAVEYENIV